MASRGERDLITLKRSEDKDEIEQIVKDPEIFARISEDGHDIDSYNISMDNCYLLVCLDERAIGVWCLHPANSSTLMIHLNMLKEFRNYGKEAGALIVQWFVETCPQQYQKMNAEIPMTYPEVYHFTKNQGMVDEGINRKSIMKAGELVDQWLLGITRKEAEGLPGGCYGVR